MLIHVATVHWILWILFNIMMIMDGSYYIWIANQSVQPTVSVMVIPFHLRNKVSLPSSRVWLWTMTFWKKHLKNNLSTFFYEKY